MYDDKQDNNLVIYYEWDSVTETFKEVRRETVSPSRSNEKEITMLQTTKSTEVQMLR
jgi:hypothetical protein